MRPDVWWVQPVLVLLGLSAFIGYSTWAAFQGQHYFSGPYLSPFYSPELFGESAHSWFGPKPGWWPPWLLWSPALLILWAPGGFRLTCYYYRGAYYKSFWGDPPACAVGEPRQHYRGEHSFPLILQNAHRAFHVSRAAILLILSHDVWKAMWFTDPITGRSSFGIGVGTLVLAVNVIRWAGTLGVTPAALGGVIADQLARADVPAHLFLRQLPESPPYAVGLDGLFWVGFSIFMCDSVPWVSGRTGGFSN